MNKINIKCPPCQKYRYKEDSRQFAPNFVSSHQKSKYPRCHKCNKPIYLNHKHKHYNRYKCGNRKCNHSFSQYNNIDIDLSENLTDSLSMKGMRFLLHTIFTSLTLYFLNNTLTRAIS